MLLWRRESPGVGEELSDDLVPAAFVRPLLQPEMSFPHLSVLLNPSNPDPTSTLLDQHLASPSLC